MEWFVDPAIPLPSAKTALRLLQKKLGFRTLFDLIPLDATLVKGTHGTVPSDKADWPIPLGTFPNAPDNPLPPPQANNIPPNFRQGAHLENLRHTHGRLHLAQQTYSTGHPH